MAPETHTTWPTDKIGRVARYVELEGVKLLHTRATSIPEAEFDPSGYETLWSVIPLGPEGPIDVESEGVVDIRDGFEVAIVFEYGADPSDRGGIDQDGGDDETGDEAQEQLEIVGVFLLSYRIREERQPQLLEEPIEVAASDLTSFAHFNATFNAWPYWREFVQSITGRMGLPVVTIPILPVPNLASRTPGEL